MGGLSLNFRRQRLELLACRLRAMAAGGNMDIREYRQGGSRVCAVKQLSGSRAFDTRTATAQSPLILFSGPGGITCWQIHGVRRADG